MDKQPQVSAIIIFLNEERFLQEAIDSVFAQTYDDWELLLVDDGSTDGSTAIARACAVQHPEKVRYLEHPGHTNRGMSASRNLGVRHARGTYISYLDGDDVWVPNKLARQTAILASQPSAVMVYGPVLCWYSWTGAPEDRQRDHLYGLEADGVRLEADRLIDPPNLLTSFLRYPSLIPAGVLVERAVIEQVGGSEEVFPGSYEDAVVLTKICLASRVYLSSESWYRYRIHPNSCQRTVNQAGKAAANHLVFLTWVERYLARQDVTDARISQALQEALWPHRHPRLHQLRQTCGSFLKQSEALAMRIGRWFLPTSIRHWLSVRREKYRFRSLNADH
jgi:glycosyltransferase involved in cell wall biosynthesis